MSGRWDRGYHRRSDDAVLSYQQHRSYAAAVKDAQQCFLDDDVDEVWVRRVLPGGDFGPYVFHLTTGPGGCVMCGWPPGQGHAPGARCAPENGKGGKLEPALLAWDAAATDFNDADTTSALVVARAAMLAAAVDLAAAVRVHLVNEEEH